MNHLTDDRWLMRAKDWILLVTAVAGIVSWAISKFYASPIAMETRVASLESRTRDSFEKYNPMVERHEVQLAVINAQYQDIKDQLRSINRKVSR